MLVSLIAFPKLVYPMSFVEDELNQDVSDHRHNVVSKMTSELENQITKSQPTLDGSKAEKELIFLQFAIVYWRWIKARFE